MKRKHAAIINGPEAADMAANASTGTSNVHDHVHVPGADTAVHAGAVMRAAIFTAERRQPMK